MQQVRLRMVSWVIQRLDMTYVVCHMLPRAETTNVGVTNCDTTCGCLARGIAHITTCSECATQVVCVSIPAVRMMYVVLTSILHTQNVAYVVARPIPPVRVAHVVARDLPSTDCCKTPLAGRGFLHSAYFFAFAVGNEKNRETKSRARL